MKKAVQLICSITAGIFLSGMSLAQTTSSFEEGNLWFWDGSSTPLGTIFKSGNSVFQNTFDTSYGGFWASGWAYSRVQDSTAMGFSNLFSARPATGYMSSNYAVGQQGAMLIVSDSSATDTVKGVYITNSTYAYLSMLNGDGFAKKFGGVSGNDSDWFRISIHKYEGGVMGTDSVVFYLADFRDNNNANDYILKDWTWVDLTSLGKADSLKFTLNSSDVGIYGMNTPAYFCIDDLVTSKNTSTFEDLNLLYWNGSTQSGGAWFESGNAVFPNFYDPSFGGFWASGWAYSAVKDSVTKGSGNLYGARAGSGFYTHQYAVGQQNAMIKLKGTDLGKAVDGVYICNGTYAYYSIMDGDMFGKKFGGVSGNDPDWFKLTIRNYYNGILTNDSVEFYLADFRDNNNSNDYIVKDWTWVDLTSLANTDSLIFTLTSSDTGMYGMNTPAFFCMDDLKTGSLSTSITSHASAEVNVYPNPASSYIHVSVKDAASYQYKFIDMKGSVIESGMLTTNIININNLPSGVYLLLLQNDKQVIQQRIIKE